MGAMFGKRTAMRTGQKVCLGTAPCCMRHVGARSILLVTVEPYHEVDDVLGEEVGDKWSTNEPPIRVGIPKSWDPHFSTKPVVRAADCFDLYFDDEVLEMIVERTNRAGALKYPKKWAVLTRDELRAYFGLLLLMSVSPRHHFYHYWSRDSLFNCEEIAKVMSFKRFQYIMNSLRVNDPSKEKKRGEDGYDRLAKLRPLIDKLNKKFQEEYSPSSHQAIDESMVAFKGRSSMKQYIPMKPIKRGYKVWCRADSKTGYLLQFQVYEGKNAQRPANQSLGEHVVLSLSENVQPGTRLFFDNYFTCTRLMETLAERSILAAGTVRTNRKDLPEELKRNNKLKKGEYLWRSKGQVTAYQWRDTKDVHLLSNFHDPTETVEVSQKLANGSSVAVICPKALADYNMSMGAVDKFDQKRNAYTSDRRSKKSWYRIFYFLFDASVVNAFIQYCANNDITYLWFRLVLGRQLINGQTFRHYTSTGPFRKNKEGRKNGQKMVGVSEEIRFTGSGHNPQKVPTRRRCRWCSTTGNEVRTKFMCGVCKVPLCATCFGAFHTK
ncbi:piggyBac transposable element-derived protein 4-like [Dermacentor andersoni]|uniref:piggyBac transposable element-derived protein 4-like n=1 Tax=Dermacentor andersoni TaxID=34620 RepID=UPI003B3B05D2